MNCVWCRKQTATAFDEKRPHLLFCGKSCHESLYAFVQGGVKREREAEDEWDAKFRQRLLEWDKEFANEDLLIAWSMTRKQWPGDTSVVFSAFETYFSDQSISFMRENDYKNWTDGAFKIEFSNEKTLIQVWLERPSSYLIDKLVLYHKLETPEEMEWVNKRVFELKDQAVELEKLGEDRYSKNHPEYSEYDSVNYVSRILDDDDLDNEEKAHQLYDLGYSEYREKYLDESGGEEIVKEEFLDSDPVPFSLDRVFGLKRITNKTLVSSMFGLQNANELGMRRQASIVPTFFNVAVYLLKNELE